MAIAELDKVWHFLGSAFLSVICFVLLSIFCQSESKWGLERNLLIAGVIAFCFGLAKEFADHLSNGWFWCKPTCQFDGWDIFVNLDGVLAGLLCVILVYLFLPQKQCDTCDATVASTTYHGDGSDFFVKDQDEEQGLVNEKLPPEQADDTTMRIRSPESLCHKDSVDTVEHAISADGDEISDLSCLPANGLDIELNIDDDSRR